MDEHDEERLSQAIRQRLWTMPVGAYLDAMAVARELAPNFQGFRGRSPLWMQPFHQQASRAHRKPFAARDPQGLPLPT